MKENKVEDGLENARRCCLNRARQRLLQRDTRTGNTPTHEASATLFQAAGTVKKKTLEAGISQQYWRTSTSERSRKAKRGLLRDAEANGPNAIGPPRRIRSSHLKRLHAGNTRWKDASSLFCKLRKIRGYGSCSSHGTTWERRRWDTVVEMVTDGWLPDRLAKAEEMQ